jgi:hypothetical protein
MENREPPPLNEPARAAMVECARELGVNEENKAQEMLAYVAMEGGSNPVVTIKAIAFCLQQLKEELER